MDSVVHFEMPYDDPERMAAFYHDAFGWETRHLGEGMGDYVLATTTESDQNGPRQAGAINGGFFPKQPDRPMQVPSIVIAVESMRDAIDRVTRAGGKVLGDPMDIPEVGKYVSFVDPEGNRVSMLEPVRQNWQQQGPLKEMKTDDGPATRGVHGSRVAGIGAKEHHRQEWSPRRSALAGSEQDFEESEEGYADKPRPAGSDTGASG